MSEAETVRDRLAALLPDIGVVADGHWTRTASMSPEQAAALADRLAEAETIKRERDELRAVARAIKSWHKRRTVILNNSDLVMAYERTRRVLDDTGGTDE